MHHISFQGIVESTTNRQKRLRQKESISGRSKFARKHKNTSFSFRKNYDSRTIVAMIITLHVDIARDTDAKTSSPRPIIGWRYIESTPSENAIPCSLYDAWTCELKCTCIVKIDLRMYGKVKIHADQGLYSSAHVQHSVKILSALLYYRYLPRRRCDD